MPKFTIECTYDLPVYRHRTYEARTLAEAITLALDDDEWEISEQDFDSCGPVRVTGAWKGEDSPYKGEKLVIPDVTQ